MPESAYCQGHQPCPVQIRHNGKRSFQDARPLPISQMLQHILPYPILSQLFRRPQYQRCPEYPELLHELHPHL